MPAWAKTTLHILVLTLIFFVVRILMRIPGSYLTGFYGIYAVFTAPFYAGIVAFYVRRWKKFYPLAFACCLFTGILMVMQPIMGADALIPMLLGLALYAFERKAGNAMQAASAAFMFAASGYPIAVLTGMFFEMTDTSSVEYIGQFVGLLLAACALSVVGITLGLKLANRR
jgi:hypothetical protein